MKKIKFRANLFEKKTNPFTPYYGNFASSHIDLYAKDEKEVRRLFKEAQHNPESGMDKYNLVSIEKLRRDT